MSGWPTQLAHFRINWQHRGYRRTAHPTYPALYVFKRSANSRFYYAETCVQGRKWRQSLKTDRLTTAFKIAGEKFKDLQRATIAEDKQRKYGRLSGDPTIGELFVSWKATLPPAKRPYHETKWGAVGPFWRAVLVTDVTPKLFRDYFLQRRRVSTQYSKSPTNGTLHKDVILLRLILSHAVEEGHLQQLPIIPHPGEIVPNPRPWLTRNEWEHLCEVLKKRIDEAFSSDNPRLTQQRLDLHDQMAWMVATMMRVGEMPAIRFRDCRVQKNSDGDRILICEVQGKRGIRTAVGRTGAASIFQQRKGDVKDANALIFPIHHREAFTELLKAAGLHLIHGPSLSAISRVFLMVQAAAEVVSLNDLC